MLRGINHLGWVCKRAKGIISPTQNHCLRSTVSVLLLHEPGVRNRAQISRTTHCAFPRQMLWLAWRWSPDYHRVHGQRYSMWLTQGYLGMLALLHQVTCIIAHVDVHYISLVPSRFNFALQTRPSPTRERVVRYAMGLRNKISNGVEFSFWPYLHSFLITTPCMETGCHPFGQIKQPFQIKPRACLSHNPFYIKWLLLILAYDHFLIFTCKRIQFAIEAAVPSHHRCK